MDIRESFQENKENKDSKTKKEYLMPKIKEHFVLLEVYQSTWSIIFLVSCTLAVIIDPFFFYIPLINEEKKCLKLDQKLMIVVLVLRSFTDIFFLLHIVFQVCILLIRKSNKNAFASFKSGWKSIIIAIWAILPLPQVLILALYSNMWSLSWTTMTLLNIFVLSQCAPRILLIYQLCMELKKSNDSITGLAWVKGLCNLELYIVASHTFGACWYYFSIQRETTCWQRACRRLKGCNPNAFSCDVETSLTKLTYLGHSCPVNPPNTTMFDFGIFSDALESGMVGSTDFLKKYMQCFWWGLRNLRFGPVAVCVFSAE